MRKYFVIINISMISSLLDPICNVPTWEMQTLTAASRCGKINGFVTAGVISLIIAITACVFIFNESAANSLRSTTLPFTEDERKTQNRNIAITAAVLIIPICILSPILGGVMNGNRWNTAQAQLKGYRATGMDPAHAMGKLQAYEQAKMQAQARMSAAVAQANATVDAGASIASALRPPRQRYYN